MIHVLENIELDTIARNTATRRLFESSFWRPFEGFVHFRTACQDRLPAIGNQPDIPDSDWKLEERERERSRFEIEIN